MVCEARCLLASACIKHPPSQAGAWTGAHQIELADVCMVRRSSPGGRVDGGSQMQLHRRDYEGGEGAPRRIIEGSTGELQEQQGVQGPACRPAPCAYMLQHRQRKLGVPVFESAPDTDVLIMDSLQGPMDGVLQTGLPGEGGKLVGSQRAGIAHREGLTRRMEATEPGPKGPQGQHPVGRSPEALFRADTWTRCMAQSVILQGLFAS